MRKREKSANDNRIALYIISIIVTVLVVFVAGIGAQLFSRSFNSSDKGTSIDGSVGDGESGNVGGGNGGDNNMALGVGGSGNVGGDEFASSKVTYTTVASDFKFEINKDNATMATITGLQDQCFANAKTLQTPRINIVVPNTVNRQGKEYLVTKIAFSSDGLDQAFASLTHAPYKEFGDRCGEVYNERTRWFYRYVGLDLTKATSLSAIGMSAFEYGKFMETELVIPTTITSIGEFAFQNAGFVNNNGLIIPSKIKVISNVAFSGCTGIKGKLTIQEGVESIAGDAFYGCTGLTGNLIIPSTVTDIQKLAFQGCTGIEQVEFVGGQTLAIPSGGMPFDGCTKLKTIVVVDKNAYDYYVKNAGIYKDILGYPFEVVFDDGVVATPNVSVAKLFNRPVGFEKDKDGVWRKGIVQTAPKARDGYTFGGWSESQVADGAHITADTIVAQPNYYAHWKLKVTVTADSKEKIYDGQPLTCNTFGMQPSLMTGDAMTLNMTADSSVVNWSATPTLNKIDTQTVEVKNGAKDVTYNYDITIVDGTLTIKKAKVTVADLKLDSLTYGTIGEAPFAGFGHTETLSGINAETITGVWTFSFVAKTSELSRANHLAKGNYVATYGFAPTSSNYNIIENQTVGFEVLPLGIDVVFVGWDALVFDNTIKNISARTSGIYNGDNASIQVDYDKAEVKNADKYLASSKVVGADNANYTINLGKTQNFEIMQRVVTATFSRYFGKFYYGEAHTIDVALSNVVESAPCQPTLTYHGANIMSDGKVVNAGNYNATLSINNANYRIDGATTQDFVVARANYDMSGIRFDNVIVTYDAKPHTNKLVGALPIGIDGIALAVTYGGVKGLTALNVSDGTVPIVATFATSSINYNTPKLMSANIAIAPIMLSVTANDKVVVEGATPLNLDYVVVGELAQGESFKGALMREAGDKAGRYAISQGTLSAGKNYIIEFVGAIYTINKISISNGGNQNASNGGENIDVEIIVNDGIAPETIFMVNVVEAELNLVFVAPDKKQIVHTYSAKLCVDGKPVAHSGTIKIKIKMCEEFKKAKGLQVVVMENGAQVVKEVAVEGEYLTFDMTELGDFAVVADDTMPIWLIAVVAVVGVGAVVAVAVVIVLVKKRGKNKKPTDAKDGDDNDEKAKDGDDNDEKAKDGDTASENKDNDTSDKKDNDASDNKDNDISDKKDNAASDSDFFNN